MLVKKKIHKKQKSKVKTPQEKKLSNLQDETSKMRDKGGQDWWWIISQGESRYCNSVDNLDFEKFNEENKEELEKELSGLIQENPSIHLNKKYES